MLHLRFVNETERDPIHPFPSRAICAERSAMKATIFHNPRCGTSRNTLAMLEAEPGIELTVIDYLKTPPSRDALARLYERAGISPREGLRTKEAAAAALAGAGDAAILDAMVADPILIERPLVETEKGVRLCRPAEKLREIL
jgi:arsenate reductase